MIHRFTPSPLALRSKANGAWRRALAALLALTLVLATLPAAFAADTFTDTSDHWAERAIETWAGHGVLLGSDGEFRPNAPITRAELAAVLNRVFGYTATTDAAFTEIGRAHV